MSEEKQEKKEKKRFERDDYFDTAMDGYPLASKVLLGFVVCLVAFLSKILWFWRIEHGDRLWENRDGRVIAMNHVSFVETLIPVVSMWFRGHHVRPIYKSEFDGNRFLEWLLPRMGGIPIDRGTTDLKAVKRAVACLKRGESILIFPEGTRMHEEGVKPEVHYGYALMARMAKVPIQPMAVSGIKCVKGTHGSLVWPFFPVRFDMGELLHYEDFKDAGGRHEQTEAFGKAGMDAVYAMRDAMDGVGDGGHAIPTTGQADPA